MFSGRYLLAPDCRLLCFILVPDVHRIFRVCCNCVGLWGQEVVFKREGHDWKISKYIFQSLLGFYLSVADPGKNYKPYLEA